ncbi:MAG: hypothetical protein ABIZ50_06530 [Solirubrobacterales bacterium]
MIATAVQFYDVVLFFHILAVVLALGPTFAYGLFIAVAQREGGIAVPAVGRAMMTWDRVAGTIGLTVVLLSGIYLVSNSPAWTASDFFVSWGFVTILLLFGVTHGYFAPKMRQSVALAERDLGTGGGPEGPEGITVKLSSEFESLGAQIAKVGTAVGLLIVLTIYVMTAKPFL